MKKIGRILLISLLLAAVVVSMSGCKTSMVITKVLYDQKAEEMDPDDPITREDPDTTIYTDELAEKAQGDSDRQTNDEKVGAKRSNMDTDQDAVSTTPTDQSENKGDAADSAGGNGQGDDSGQDQNGDQENETDYSDPNSDNTNSDDPGTGGTDPYADSENTRPVYNPDGSVSEVPDHGLIVAADEVAAMAVILGGTDILIGTSESLMTDSLAIQVLGLTDQVKTYWSGSGSSPMSSTSIQDIINKHKELKAKNAKSGIVCVGVTGKNSFSGDQIRQLQENGVSYLSLPELNSDESISNAMGLLAEVIGNQSSNGGKNAPKIAQQYEDYCSSLVNKVEKNTSSDVVTLYLSGWNYDATLIVASGGGNELAKETGVGVVKNDPGENPLQYYLDKGGVINNAFELSRSAGNAFAAIPLNINVYKDSTSIQNGGALTIYRPTEYSFALYKRSVGLGTSQFPCVVTNSINTKEALMQSKRAGIWQDFGIVNYNNANYYGFEAYNMLVQTWVRADFEVYVNPYGVTGWADGSAESVLESIWAAYQINGAFTKDECISEMKNFYQKFYGYALSDSEAELILEGKYE